MNFRLPNRVQNSAVAAGRGADSVRAAGVDLPVAAVATGVVVPVLKAQRAVREAGSAAVAALGPRGRRRLRAQANAPQMTVNARQQLDEGGVADIQKDLAELLEPVPQHVESCPGQKGEGVGLIQSGVVRGQMNAVRDELQRDGEQNELGDPMKAHDATWARSHRTVKLASRLRDHG